MKIPNAKGMITIGPTACWPKVRRRDLAEDPVREGAVAFLVHVEPETERTVRINITAREKAGRGNRQAANEAGLTRSAYMVQSALHRYPGPGRAGRIKHGAKDKARHAAG